MTLNNTVPRNLNLNLVASLAASIWPRAKADVLSHEADPQPGDDCDELHDEGIRFVTLFVRELVFGVDRILTSELTRILSVRGERLAERLHPIALDAIGEVGTEPFDPHLFAEEFCDRVLAEDRR